MARRRKGFETFFVDNFYDLQFLSVEFYDNTYYFAENRENLFVFTFLIGGEETSHYNLYKFLNRYISKTVALTKKR